MLHVIWTYYAEKVKPEIIPFTLHREETQTLWELESSISSSRGSELDSRLSIITVTSRLGSKSYV